MTFANREKIPNTWSWTTIGDVAATTSGGTPSRKRIDYYEHGSIPWIKSGELNDGIVTSAEEHITEEALANSNAKVFPTGTTLVALYGATVGKTGILGIDAATNQAICAIFPEFNAFSAKFMDFWLKFNRKILIKLSIGGAQPNISQGIINSFPLPLPPLLEQHRIVARIEELFSRMDAGVQALRRASAQLQRYLQSVLQAAVEGRLTAEWRKEHKKDLRPFYDFLEETSCKVLKDEDGLSSGISSQDLPDLWISARIEEIADVVRGASPRPAGDPRYFGGDIPWITVGEITKDSKMYLESVSSFLTGEGKERSRYIKSGTFLLTNSGATLGVPKITKVSGCINDGSVAILNLNDTLKVFLYYYLSTQTKSLRRINQGAAQPNLNTGIVKNLMAPRYFLWVAG